MNGPMIYLTGILIVMFVFGCIIGVIEALNLKDYIPDWWPNSRVDECGAVTALALAWPLTLTIMLLFGYVFLVKFLMIKIVKFFIRKHNEFRELIEL